ncbi:MAG: DUF4838 domain-containing protein [Planctomycetota bacterium]|jgi:hypothetical protein
MNVIKKYTCRLTLLICFLLTFQSVRAEDYIVKEGKAEAQIIIAEKPLRMVKLAAEELQSYLKKITGAELPIVNKPVSDFPVKIYIGKSSYTEETGISTEGLKYGAFHLASKDNWFALIGNDFDFTPKEPTPKSNGDTERSQLEWEKLTGAKWLNPMVRTYKNYHQKTGYWQMDEGGSLNAVYDFLRSLGVRWYMPGELGEIVPQRKSIKLTHINKTVKPSFSLRCFNWVNYNEVGLDDLLWDRRMGLNTGYELWGAKTFVSHGIRAVIGHPEMKTAHPEYYAIQNNRRMTEKNHSGRPCLTSEGLIKETINYCRAVFDHYDEPMVCIWPTDGFAQCECESCSKIDHVSDYVWGFVNSVAKEVYKTHPDKKISCGAYNIYVAPPPSIEKLSPNVVVYIANRGRPGFNTKERWEKYLTLIKKWQKRVAPGNIIRGENNRYTLSLGVKNGPVAFAPLHPREFAKDLEMLKGICMGERNESPRGVRTAAKRYSWRAPGLDHLNLYVNARFLWNADLDIDEVLEEYFTLFYGPAAEKMKAAFNFADANFPAGKGSKKSGSWLPPFEIRAKLVEKLQAALEQAGDTVYGKRIQLIISELPSLKELQGAIKLAGKRGSNTLTFNRLLDLHIESKKERRESFKADGKLTEEFWTWYPHGRDLKSGDGKRPPVKTKFLARWYNNSIYFGIRCEHNLKMKTAALKFKDDDREILNNEHLEILLETSPECFYRIAINPAGSILDLRITDTDEDLRWSANAETGVYAGDGYWSAEIRIPVVGAEQAGMDPLNRIAASTPTQYWPWYFNIGRISIIDNKPVTMSYSPTGKSKLTDRMKFAKLRLRKVERKENK